MCRVPNNFKQLGRPNFTYAEGLVKFWLYLAEQWSVENFDKTWRTNNQSSNCQIYIRMQNLICLKDQWWAFDPPLWDSGPILNASVGQVDTLLINSRYHPEQLFFSSIHPYSYCLKDQWWAFKTCWNRFKTLWERLGTSWDMIGTSWDRLGTLYTMGKKRPLVS